MIRQDSPEWVRERIGCLTASRMKDAAAKLKNGKPSEARERYMKEIVAERMADVAADHFVTAAMRWGLDMEAEARDAFELETGILLSPAVLVQHPTIAFFKATPDALIGDDAVWECKCPTTSTYVSWRQAGVVPEEHRLQILAQLACTQRRRAVFCAYDPRVPAGLQMFVRAWTPEPEEIAAVEAIARDFLADVDALFDAVTQTVSIEV